MFRLQYNTIQYKTYNAPYVTKMLFVGAEAKEDLAIFRYKLLNCNMCLLQIVTE